MGPIICTMAQQGKAVTAFVIWDERSLIRDKVLTN